LSLLRAQLERYDLVVLDAGEYGTLLRSLALPDSFRWGLRLLVGLDRGPGRSPQSQARALVPLSLLPFEWLGQVQQARVETEELRDIAAHSAGATVGFVLAPDAPSLREAQVAVPALQLYGLAVAALIVGPLLPDDIDDSRLAPLIGQQRTVMAQAQELWSPRPLLPLPLTAATSDSMQTLGEQLYAQAAPTQLFSAAAPLAVQPGPTLSLRLPLLTKGSLRLTVSGDEIIVRVGAYRRHLLLPEGLRGATAIKATRSGDEVLISRREG
jgi:anion-transporting  ArsA/GET3 family ATPase